MSSEKHALDKKKKIFRKKLNLYLTLSSRAETTVYPTETHWLPGKETVLDAVVSKEGFGDSAVEREHFFGKV